MVKLKPERLHMIVVSIQALHSDKGNRAQTAFLVLAIFIRRGFPHHYAGCRSKVLNCSNLRNVSGGTEGLYYFLLIIRYELLYTVAWGILVIVFSQLH